MIINYAWAHPVTGLREQTPRRLESEAGVTLSQARAMLWDELQGTDVESAVVHQQTHIATITPGNWKMEGATLEELEAASINFEFAWCDPWTGKRMVSDTFPTHLADQLKDDPREFCKELWIYAILASHPVRQDDPRPEVPVETPAAIPEHATGNPSLIGAKKAELEELVTLGDPALEVAKLTAWALLDIAENVRNLTSVQIEKLVPAGVGPLTSPFTSDGNRMTAAPGDPDPRRVHPNAPGVFRHPYTGTYSCDECGPLCDQCGYPKEHGVHQGGGFRHVFKSHPGLAANMCVECGYLQEHEIHQ